MVKHLSAKGITDEITDNHPIDICSEQPTVLFSIYQNIAWTIILVDETIGPATQRIILKIVGFQYIILRLR